MWFAALDDPRRLMWFLRFLQRVLENEPAVTALLEKIRFPISRPCMCARYSTTTAMPTARKSQRAYGGTAEPWGCTSPRCI